ncbi:TonB-dependent receptor [Sphingobium yanoikuyae]|uniref:TonB-dependent receptor n=1 Tax=Sphingobium yanoikuyae TaxID=13690 RepID=A0A430BW09_SPHYA|nr:TonB-dependent receptor [Sphingobium yanoikuyae]RSU56780.1 TonB-dependent receptor [Sphingobium yanoikuyae]
MSQVLAPSRPRHGLSFRRLLLAGVAIGLLPSAAHAADEPAAAAPAPPPEAAVDEGDYGAPILVTARRRAEKAQDVPVALSVVGGDLVEQRGDYTLAAVQQVAPSLQLFSFNPRNTNINIRGLGSNVALTNDGLENGVGVYIDDVYYGRVGASQFDLVDLERIEVLRGPQGTLFGKNTTAGAINITTRQPSFDFGGQVEATLGDYGFHQLRGSVTGGLTDWAAVRVSIADTHRDGFLTNVHNGKKIHDYDNFTARGQLLLTQGEGFSLRLIGDYAKQTLNCCVRLPSTVFTTYDDGNTIANNFAIRAARAGYTPLATDPFARKVDVDGQFQANMNQWGISGKADWDVGPVTLSSITAYRAWNWYPRNDSDATSLSVNTLNHQENNQRQFSQEFRVASNGDTRLSYVLGAYYFWQIINGSGAAGYGVDAPLWLFPNADPVVSNAAVNGFVARSSSNPETKSAALFGQASYAIIPDSLSLTLGLRYTHEKKQGSYSQWWAEGNDLSSLTAAQRTAAIALRNSLNPITSYSTGFTDNSLSGLATLSYKVTPDVLVYATYSRGNKSGGLNLTNIPAGVSPDVGGEKVDNYEAGVKSQFWGGKATLNAAAFWTNIFDYQTAITEQIVGTNSTRNYITNIPEARARGFELDGALALSRYVNLNASLAYTDAYYVDFKNGPTPVEALNPTTGGSAVTDLSGKPLSGVPEWSWSAGGDFAIPLGTTKWGDAQFYGRADYSWRSSYYTAVSDSRYSLVPSYGVANARIGVRLDDGLIDLSLWAKNLFDKDYVDTLSVANTGLVTATVGDPRTIGVTLRSKF